MSVTWQQIREAMLVALRPLWASTHPPAPGAYLRTLDWYGGEFSSKEAYDGSNVPGRCPAVLVDFMSDRVIRTTADGRAQLVEATFGAVCISDSFRSPKDQESTALDRIVIDVQRVLSNRRLVAGASALRYAGLQLIAKEPRLFAYVCRFTTRYHSHSSISAEGVSRLASFQGLLHQVGGSGEVSIHLSLPEEP